MDTFMKAAVLISLALIPPVVASQGLGDVVVLAPEGTVAIPNQYTVYTSTDAIATALAATELTAQGAADLTAVLSQTNAPSRVYVATYDDATETPADAIDRLLAAGIDVGVITTAARATTDLAALGTWLASGDRRIRYHVIAQSSEATLVTATPTASLNACQVDGFDLHYHDDDTQPQAAAKAGRLAGKSLASGPIGGRLQILGVALPDITPAEQVFAEANNVSVLYPLDVGATATERILFGRNNYSGTSFKAQVTAQYAIRRMVAAGKALILRHAITGDPIPATDQGAALWTATLDGPMAELAAARHFTPGVTGTGDSTLNLANGYRVTTTVSDDDLVASVVMRIGREVHTFRIDGTGEVI